MQMKAKCLLIILFFSIFIYSCNSSNVEGEKATKTIDLTGVLFSDEPQLLSLFVDSIEYVRLSDTPLIPDLRMVHLAEDSKGYLYVDFSNISKYTPEGKYIKSLFKKGQGPGEIYAKNAPGIYNKSGNYVLVSNYGAPYNKYTLEGEFIETVKERIEDVNFDVLAYWNDCEIFRYEKDDNPDKGDIVNLDSVYFIRVKDKAGKIIYQLPNYHFDIKAVSPGHGTIVILGGIVDCGEMSEKRFWIKPNYVDTVYCTSDWTDVHPYYIIKLSDRAADYTWSVHMKVGDITRNDASKEQLGTIYALESGVLFSYIFNREQQGVGFCPANGKGKTVSKLFKNDIDEYCPPLDLWQTMGYKLFYQKDGYLYLLVDAFKFFEEGARSPFADLTEDSNPVLIKLKLK
jgi:hypothetical protein